jgi:hypothetical protein
MLAAMANKAKTTDSSVRLKPLGRWRGWGNEKSDLCMVAIFKSKEAQWVCADSVLRVICSPSGLSA